MWRSRALLIARRSAQYRARGATLGAAVSLVVLSSLDRQDQDTEMNLSSRDNYEGSDRALNTMKANPLSILSGLTVSSASCEAGTMASPIGRRTRLARRATIRKMDENQSRDTLRSKYAVDWDDPLGEGGFGAVYLATDRRTGEKVACKKIDKKFTDDSSFQHEMNALLHLRKAGGHPNICSLREHFNEDGYYYLILDLVQGGEMFDHLVANGAYSEADAARLVREVASALAFVHGMDTTHGDLKPENLMLSSENPSEAVIKLVDFGCAKVDASDSAFAGEPGDEDDVARTAGKTPAYCPPECLGRRRKNAKVEPPMDMWALGIIIYIMLTGVHPYDLSGETPDDEIEREIASKTPPPLKDSPITEHLSSSAIDLIDKLLCMNERRRMTAEAMLEHPWVRGETAKRDIMADSDKKLAMHRKFKSRIEQKIFENILAWSEEDAGDSPGAKRMSLIERSFHSFDPHGKGYIDAKDLRRITKDASAETVDEDTGKLTLSQFEELISSSMRNKYFPKGHIIFREGDVGNAMYVINSGIIELTTKDGYKSTLSHGEFIGEGSLLDSKKRRSASCRCVTPVHVIEISRDYFNKYLAGTDMNVSLNLRERSKSRKRHRAKSSLRLQQNMEEKKFQKGEYLYKEGDAGDNLYILERGKINVVVQDQTVFSLKPGDMCGEHALISGRKRNSSAKCMSDECVVLAMKARDFNAFLKKSPHIKDSMYDICMRRELQKAIVFKTKKAFPQDNADLRAAFEAADEDDSGKISLDNVRTMLLRMDPTISKTDMKHVLKSLDLDESGDVKWEEFQRIFQANKD